MIKVDISNVWGQVSLPELLALEKEVFAAHNTLTEGNGPGNDFLGWLELPPTSLPKKWSAFRPLPRRSAPIPMYL